MAQDVNPGTAARGRCLGGHLHTCCRAADRLLFIPLCRDGAHAGVVLPMPRFGQHLSYSSIHGLYDLCALKWDSCFPVLQDMPSVYHIEQHGKPFVTAQLHSKHVGKAACSASEAAGHPQLH